MDFAPLDKRNYPTLSVRTRSLSRTVKTYDAVVRDEMDLSLLARIEIVSWSGDSRILDLACGTGRIGAWLRVNGAGFIDRVDLDRNDGPGPDQEGLRRAASRRHL